ncbi:hypothetical protein QPL79_08230 [Ignisphaera sp. 4213-co]|uniref:Hemerythrin-like domain-containing protein n=1 Tax=Ignisphaera cupida TaxID=3050454 RepID=A0ABD4Z7L8_9CREN|nr:hypothetical protein [Ignisphaera sp. 4213-co]MDK6029347.1 hypothetical protein [Ignisphaera sp. 4213-co]
MGIETGLRDIIENGTGYIQLLRNHIWIEDNILFQIALQFLNEDDDAKLVEEFEEIEEKRIGHGKHEELVKSIEDLSKEFN